MKTPTNRPFALRLQDFTVGSMSVGAVLAGVACIDDTARALLIRLVNGGVSFGEVMPDWRLHGLMRSATELVMHDHPEVAAFVAIGFVLFLAMFKL